MITRVTIEIFEGSGTTVNRAYLVHTPEAARAIVDAARLLRFGDAKVDEVPADVELFSGWHARDDDSHFELRTIEEVAELPYIDEVLEQLRSNGSAELNGMRATASVELVGEAAVVLCAGDHTPRF